MPEPISNAEKRKLKAASQHLKANLKIGRAGITPQLIAALEEILKHHELVKVKFDEFKEERKTLAPQLAEKTASELIWMVGHVAVLYRKKATAPPESPQPSP
jgi:RNA-binding protein